MSYEYLLPDDGGGVAVTQPQLNKSIIGYYTNLNSEYSWTDPDFQLVRDYFPVYNNQIQTELNNYFNGTGTTKLKGTTWWSGGVIQGIYYPSDSWVNYKNIRFYQNGNTQYWIRAGYCPQFTLDNKGNPLFMTTVPGDYYIHMVNDKIYIYKDGDAEQEVPATYFKDGVVPKRLIIMLQGAGGGGGSAQGIVSGNGGGSGGFVYCILNTTYQNVRWRIRVGSGGLGGVSGGNGAKGGDSYIQYDSDNLPPESPAVYAYGGGGGTNGDGSAGAGGGTFVKSDSIGVSLWLSSVGSTRVTGASGGKDGNDGYDMGVQSFYATNNRNKWEYINVISTSMKEGGAGTASTGGGGGASIWAHGGSEGSVAGGPGFPGTFGSGGGGGRFAGGAGGNGGDGLLTIYY